MTITATTHHENKRSCPSAKQPIKLDEVGQEVPNQNHKRSRHGMPQQGIGDPFFRDLFCVRS